MTEPLDDARGELLACPFCGGRAGVMKAAGSHQACCADPSCPANGIYETHAEAVKVWNTRAAPVTQCEAEPGEIARLRKALDSECENKYRLIAENLDLQGKLENRFPPSRSDAESAELTQFLLRQLDGPMPASTEVLAKELSYALLTRFPLVPPPSEAGSANYFAWDWQGLLWDALGDQTKVDRVLALARERGMFDLVRLAALSDPGTVAVTSTLRETPA